MAMARGRKMAMIPDTGRQAHPLQFTPETNDKAGLAPALSLSGLTGLGSGRSGGGNILLHPIQILCHHWSRPAH